MAATAANRKAEPAARGKGRARARAHASGAVLSTTAVPVPGPDPREPGPGNPSTPTREPRPRPRATTRRSFVSRRAAAHAFDAAPWGRTTRFCPRPRRIFASVRTSRASREVAGLGSTLPCPPASSAFVRVDEERSVLWSVLITGPEDTPYDGGAFVFDAFFLSGYPTPRRDSSFEPRGADLVRFNPNLYKDGRCALAAWHVERRQGGDVGSRRVHHAPGDRLRPIAHLRAATVFQRAGVRTIHRHRGRHAKCAEYNAFVREDTLRCAVWRRLRNRRPPSRTRFARISNDAAHILGPNVRAVDGRGEGEAKRRIEGLFADGRRNWRNCEGDKLFLLAETGGGPADEDASALRETADGTEMFDETNADATEMFGRDARCSDVGIDTIREETRLATLRLPLPSIRSPQFPATSHL